MIEESKAVKSIKEIDAYSLPNGKEGPVDADGMCYDVHGSIPQESAATEDDVKEL